MKFHYFGKLFMASENLNQYNKAYSTGSNMTGQPPNTLQSGNTLQQYKSKFKKHAKSQQQQKLHQQNLNAEFEDLEASNNANTNNNNNRNNSSQFYSLRNITPQLQSLPDKKLIGEEFTLQLKKNSSEQGLSASNNNGNLKNNQFQSSSQFKKWQSTHANNINNNNKEKKVEFFDQVQEKQYQELNYSCSDSEIQNNFNSSEKKQPCDDDATRDADDVEDREMTVNIQEGRKLPNHLNSHRNYLPSYISSKKNQQLIQQQIFEKQQFEEEEEEQEDKNQAQIQINNSQL